MHYMAIALGIIIGYLFKGRLNNLINCNLSKIYLVFIGFTIDVIMHLLLIKNVIQVSVFTYIAHIIMYAILFTFVFFNRKNKFIILMGFGYLLNALIIFSNGGVMPVSEHAIIAAKLPHNVQSEGLYVLASEKTKLKILGDNFTNILFGNIVFSLGDSIGALGLFLFLIFGMQDDKTGLLLKFKNNMLKPKADR